MFPRVTAVFLLVASAGCASGALPDGAQISCDTSDGCPPGTTCAAALGRCVDATDDRDAPVLLGEPLPTPSIGGAGASFDLEIVTNEQLGRAPEAIATVGRFELPAFTLVDASDDGLAYHFKYTAAGDEPEGVATIEVVLVDESGNLATVAAGSFTLDFEAPALLADISLDVEFAKAETTVTARVSFDEVLADDAEVTLVALDGQAPPFLAPPRMSPAGDDTFIYVTSGDEPEGRYGVRAEGRDAAGNVVVAESAAAVTFDFTPPAQGNSAIDASVQREGNLVMFNVAFSEPILQRRTDIDGTVVLSPTASAQLAGGVVGTDVIPLDPLVFPEPNNVIFVHQVRTCDLPGHYDITVTDVIDLAGNRAPPMTSEAWRFTIGGEGCLP